MKKTFDIFTNPFEFSSFINGLSAQKKKFTVSPWTSKDGKETGFVVWHY